MDWLEPRKNASEKKSDSEKSSSTLQPETLENKISTSNEVYQQQQSIDPPTSEVTNNTKPQMQVSQETKQEIKDLCLAADIQLPEKCEVFYYPIEDIKISLGFLKLRSHARSHP